MDILPFITPGIVEIQISIFESVVAGITLAALLGMWAFLVNFAKKQKVANNANKVFIRSMQRAEIIRYFRTVVEQGNPISPEEMEHLTACYESYHGNGGNGTGTFMYKKILEHVKMVTEPNPVDKHNEKVESKNEK